VTISQELRLYLWISRTNQLTDIAVGAFLLAETENFARSVIGFNHVVVREADYADAVPCLFEDGAVTLFTVSQLTLLPVNHAEQQGYHECIHHERDNNVLDPLHAIYLHAGAYTQRRRAKFKAFQVTADDETGFHLGKIGYREDGSVGPVEGEVELVLPNVVRLVIGERLAASASAPGPSDNGPGAATTVVKIECEVDDMSPQLFEPASDKLFAAGALDVFLTAVQMKKGRPGTLITVIAPEDERSAICDVLFRETTTIGVRFERMSREVLDRRWEEVSTAGGSVRIKVSGRHGETLNAVPEFEDCLRVANATGQPVKHVQAEAMRAWLDRIQ